ncbi:MAG: tryptophan--tRNA ligase [Synergistaceae bacterium]|jgi:tryptophanyl-tRNA synthetase|nr:tryptophan--tRNA ligase [Synergistaceae bacterium]
MYRVFSGMRPTGRLHLGHMAGALTNWTALQEDHECYYSIVDWHALMSDYADPSRLGGNTMEVLLDWLAVGLDPQKCAIFVQSHVKEHVELHLALSMISPLGWLERNPTYKEQILNLQNKDLSTYGFLGYPVLMASDILVYKSHKVPVGEDQSAHLELSREIARRFNNFYGKGREIFPEPEIMLTHYPKIPGTDGRKMSKSYGNSLDIADEIPVLDKKIRTMMTDPARERRTDKGEPEKCPVWDLHKFFNRNDEQRAELADGCRTAGIGCIDCKKALMVHVTEHMTPIHERRRHFEARVTEMEDLLHAGAIKAKDCASRTMNEVYEVLGMLKCRTAANRSD